MVYKLDYLDCSKTKTKPMIYKPDYLDCSKTKTKPMTYKVDYLDCSKTKTKPREIAWWLLSTLSWNCSKKTRPFKWVSWHQKPIVIAVANYKEHAQPIQSIKTQSKCM